MDAIHTPLVADGTNQPTLTGDTEAIEFGEDYGPLLNLVSFNIRNGDVRAARSMLVKATIPRFWHWVPISGMPSTMAIRHTAAYVRSTYVHMLKYKSDAMHVDLVRKIAIIVGVARAVVTETYNITDSDLIPGEREQPLLVATTNQAGVLSITTVTTVDNTDKNKLKEALDITATEQAVVAAVTMSAIGLPPLQGYSLFMTQHHYLSDPKGQSRRAFDVVERSCWSSNAVKPWWEANLEEMRDALWHKACHPLTISLKMTLAQRPEVKEMLVTAGCGPAAARLPAMESEVRKAQTYKTLLQTVRPMYEDMGAATNYRTLDEALAAVRHYPYGAVVAERLTLQTVPEHVASRKAALAHLEAVCESSTDVVAHAFGFYKAMSERTTSLSTGNATDTLVLAYSLETLTTTSPGAYHEGRVYYEDYHAKKSKDRAAGVYSAHNLITASVGGEGVERYD